MARPLKEGIDYFSLDCYMDDKESMCHVQEGKQLKNCFQWSQ